MTPFKLQILTPDGVFFDGMTDNVIVRTTVGDKGILAHHEPYVAAITAFTVIWISPVVLFNSSMWAQCDSIYTFFALLAVYLLYKEKNIPAFVFLGIALSFKLQAIFVLPFFLFIYF